MTVDWHADRREVLVRLARRLRVTPFFVVSLGSLLVIAVAALILRQGGAVALVGLLVGLGGALAAARFLDALLFEMSSTDPATYAVVSLGLFAVSLLACWLPARRVTRLDPLMALRSE